MLSEAEVEQLRLIAMLKGLGTMLLEGKISINAARQAAGFGAQRDCLDELVKELEPFYERLGESEDRS